MPRRQREVEPVATGKAFSDGQQQRIQQAAESATQETGLDFSVYVGDVEQTPDGSIRPAAEALHAELGQRAANAVLLVVAPGQRRLEIVTGPQAHRRLPDRSCALAALSMTTSFAGGDLVGGIVTGLRMVADVAGRAPVDVS